MGPVSVGIFCFWRLCVEIWNHLATQPGNRILQLQLSLFDPPQSKQIGGLGLLQCLDCRL